MPGLLSKYKKTTGAFIELLLVVSIGFGLFIYSATESLLQRHQGISKTYGDSSFLFIVFYEIIALTLIAMLLRYRKWSIADVNLDFRFHYIAIALFLVFIRTTLSYTATSMMITFGMEIPSAHFDTGLFSILSIILINSIYEEVLLTGYIFKRFEKWHAVVPLLFGFLLRASFHTYQGWGMLPSVLALTLVTGIYYLKYQRLVPVILTHAFGNGFYFLNDHYQWVEF